MATSDEIAATIRTKEDRLEEVVARLDELDNELAEAKDGLGRAIASDESDRHQELQERVRDLEAERDGHENAREVLEEEIEELRARKDEAKLREAEERRDELIDRAHDRIDELAAEARAALRDLYPEIEETRSVIEEADQAQQHARSLDEASYGSSHSKAAQRFEKHAPIARLLAVADAYAEEHGWD